MKGELMTGFGMTTSAMNQDPEVAKLGVARSARTAQSDRGPQRLNHSSNLPKAL